MAEADRSGTFAGGCLCGALRYEARGAPLYAGHCYCADCRRASGSGFIPFMGFARAHISFAGDVRQYRSPAASGTIAVRNFCAVCNSLVYGGEREISSTFTVYAGSLDDASLFRPAIGIFMRGRPAWAAVPPGFRCFEGAPG